MQNDEALLTRLSLKRSRAATFSYGVFRFLDLDALIASKEAAGRERDLAALRHLRAIKERLEKQNPSNNN